MRQVVEATSKYVQGRVTNSSSSELERVSWGGGGGAGRQQDTEGKGTSAATGYFFSSTVLYFVKEL